LLVLKEYQEGALNQDVAATNSSNFSGRPSLLHSSQIDSTAVARDSSFHNTGHFGVLDYVLVCVLVAEYLMSVRCGGDQVSDIVKNAERQGKAAGRTKTTRRPLLQERPFLLSRSR
jgi:3-dehydroquinate synthase class II